MTKILEVMLRFEMISDRSAKRRAVLAHLDTLTQSIFLEMFGDPAKNPKGWPVQRFAASLDTKVGSGAVGTASQGNSVSLSADGNTAIVGGVDDNGGAGAAWVFAAAGQARPIITSFQATPSTITPGQFSTLSWTTANVTSVSLSGVAGTQPVNGSVFVLPTVSTTYTLTVSGSGGTATAITTVTVNAGRRRAVAPPR